MDKTSPLQKKKIKTETVVTIILFLIIAVAAIYVSIFYLFEEEPEIKLTTTYKNIDIEAAYKLINKSKNLVIIDCRGLEGCGSCQIKKDGRLDFDFVYLNDNPYIHFNTTENLLIYSKNGTVAEEDFCKILVNHVYGKIYNLRGGFEAWKNAGYPITNSIPPEYPG
jgi:rhodanese-related sulfurtransferase